MASRDWGHALGVGGEDSEDTRKQLVSCRPVATRAWCLHGSFRYGWQFDVEKHSDVIGV